MPPLDQPVGEGRVGRRNALKLLAASFALGGCDPAGIDGVYVPAVVQPPEIVPGLPNFYATASLAGGSAVGILVEHRMGRPIKVEGNPAHPSSLGATDALAQALILDFYDPDRASGLQYRAQPAGQPALLAALVAARSRLAVSGGAGLRILTGGVVSPTLGAALDRVLAAYPGARWHQWEPVNRDAVRAGATLAWGRPLDAVPRLAEADVLLALDSDLLDRAPGHLRHARHFASRRNPTRGGMSRVYAAEATPSLIGASADHRFVAGPRDMHAVVTALAAGILHNAAADAPPWLAPVLADLRAHRGRAVVHAGPSLPAEAHALVAAVNAAVGAPIDLIEPPDHRPELYGDSLRALQSDMEGGQVETLLILDSNPAYTAPGFQAAMDRVPLVVSTSAALDETGVTATWWVPMAHGFEGWGDARGHDGTATVMQPQALPLYGGRSPLELLGTLTDLGSPDPRAAVRATWQDRLPTQDAWEDALATGIVPGTASAPVPATLRPDAATAAWRAPSAEPVHLLIRPDPHLLDGRHANNAWLQELPRPLTKLVWDNPLLIPPALAKAHGLANGAEVELSGGGHQLTLPVWIVPGQAPDCVVGLLGGGRRKVGDVGTGTGWDLTPFRDAEGTVVLRPTGRQVPLASTNHYNPIGAPNDGFVRHATLAEFTAKNALLKGEGPAPSLYRRKPEGAVQWGMSIDLNACIGCNACVVACQAENNVPVVGKAAVLHQREMHWLRIDRYYEGEADAPATLFQPVLCMHCEEAPCEPVCPFGATVHDQEGLNVMVYNRCGGTRFCSNNCPYKVRRFNYAAYAKAEHRPPIARNPDVTVRSRGVMEKCTFCVQRIAEARIGHDRDGVPEQAVTACQGACPTRAITFGDLNDPGAEVVARKKSPLDYALLEDQSTHPRVTYEGRVFNPNPDAAA